MRLFGSAPLELGMVAIAMSGIIGCTKNDAGRSQSHSGADVNSKLPSLALVDLDGNAFDLWKQKPNAATVVVFTRSDCPISNRFAPEIRRLYEVYQPRGSEFYLVYLDPRERPDAIRKHMKEFGYPCQGLRDPKHSLVALCEAEATPEAAVFDKDWTIVYRGRINDLYAELGKRRPEPTKHDLADAIESTLLGRAVAMPRTKAIGCPIEGLAD